VAKEREVTEGYCGCDVADVAEEVCDGAVAIVTTVVVGKAVCGVLGHKSVDWL